MTPLAEMTLPELLAERAAIEAVILWKLKQAARAA